MFEWSQVHKQFKLFWTNICSYQEKNTRFISLQQKKRRAGGNSKAASTPFFLLMFVNYLEQVPHIH